MDCLDKQYNYIVNMLADTSGRDCGFESRRGMNVLLCWVLCVVRLSSLCRADHPSRGVLLSVLCLSALMKPPQ